MQFQIMNEKLGYVETLFRRTVDCYLSMLQTKFFFQAKLNVMDIIIKGNFDREADECSSFSVSEDGNSCCIVIVVDQDMDENECIRVCAHELAHCLMSRMLLHCHMYDSGTEYFLTGAGWWIDGVNEGIGFEEGFADLLADEVKRRVLNINPSKKARQRKKSHETSRDFLLFAIDKLSRCFGKRIEQLDFLDEMQQIGCIVCEKYAAFRSEDTLKLQPLQHISNELWYSLVTQSFPNIGIQYDELMGKNSFRSLARKLRIEYNNTWTENAPDNTLQIPECGTPEEKALSVDERRNSILQDIAEFKRRKSEKDRRESSSAAWAKHETADSLKMLIDVLRHGTRLNRIARLWDMCEGSEHGAELIAALKKSLNKSRVWTSIPKAYALTNELIHLCKTESLNFGIIVQTEILMLLDILQLGADAISYYGKKPDSEK